MVYKNLLKRFLISIFLIISYIIILNYNIFYIKYLIIILYLIIIIEIILNFKRFKLIVCFYIFVSFFFFYNIELSSKNIFLFNLLIVTIITFDIFSYLVGSFIGKLKILKTISPNKTLEGLLGGAFFSFLSSIIFILLNNQNLNFQFFMFISLIIIFSFFGDLIESYFKRLNNIKNSSNFLPGHGGFFDRFDGFIFSIIPYSFLNGLL